MSEALLMVQTAGSSDHGEKRREHGPHSEFQGDTDPGDSHDPFTPDLSAYANDRVRAFWEDTDSGFGSGAGVELSVVGSRPENTVAIPLAGTEEFSDSEVADLSRAFQRTRQEIGSPRGGAKSDDVVVDEWWYPEGVERDAFCIIRDHARNLRFGTPELTGRQLLWRANALAFFFSQPSLQTFRLPECTMALDESIRPDVIRLRLVYEMLERWLVLPAAIGDCVALPSIVRDRLYADDRILDEAICEQVWFQPGIQAAVVVSRVQQVIEQDAFLRRNIPAREVDPTFIGRRLEELVQEGTIGAQFDNCYLVGRNPRVEAETRARASRGAQSLRGDAGWSRLF